MSLTPTHSSLAVIKSLLTLSLMSAFSFSTAMAQGKPSDVKEASAPSKALEGKAQTPASEWNLSELSKDEKSWNKELKIIESNAKKVKACEGKLGLSAKDLVQCLNTLFDSYKHAGRICSWSGLLLSTDSLSSKNTANSQRCYQLSSVLSEAGSFVSPEIVKLGSEKINKMVAENKSLKPYDQFLRSTLDQGKHTLSPKEEALYSALMPAIGKSSETFNLLINADVKWSTVKLSTGEVEANVANYVKYRSSENAEDRKKIFQAFYKTLADYERTLGSTLGQTVIARNTSARVRNYKNALSQALSRDSLPESIYRTLVSEVNRSLPTLQRYLKLRAKMLGLKKPEYSDAYPIAIKAPKKFPLDVTQAMTLKSLEPLGRDYVQKFAAASTKDWMSVYPKKGKRSGAFMSSAAYDVHPYVFLNHQDDYNSASTYTHEWGHALHSLLTNENQPYAKSDYSIFVAEIAAITNEILLNDYAIKTAKNDEEKLYYLNEALESIRTTYFRQTQFAEFELAIHEEAEKSGSLTGQKMSEIFGDIQRKHYGHKKGVMNIDPLYSKEWAFVPHFYGGFYVFQYSTSMAGAYYFSDKILKGDEDALRKYLTALKAGNSKYPHEILLDAGLDLSKSDPYRVLDKRAQKLMDEMEKLVKKRPAQKPKA